MNMTKNEKNHRMNIFHWFKWWWEILFIYTFYNYKEFNIIRRFMYIWQHDSWNLQIDLYYTWFIRFWWIMKSFFDESRIMTKWISIISIICLYSIILLFYWHFSIMIKAYIAFVKWLSSSIINDISNCWFIERVDTFSYHSNVQ